MKFRSVITFFVLLGSCLTGSSSFLFTESFTGTTVDSNWIFGGDDVGTDTPWVTAGDNPNTAPVDPLDTDGDGWLRLTRNTGNQSAYAFFDASFPAEAVDISVSFDFAVYNGSGADGFTFFLFDAAFSPDPGAFGGSLGYANRSGVDGLAGGVVGVGYDNWGNFSNSNEGRNGGVGFIPNSVTVRGPGAGQGANAGYEYLTHANLDSQGQMDFPGSSTRPGQTGTDYRNTTITILSNGLLSVEMTFGFGQTPVEVISDFDIFNGTGTLTNGLPSTLKFGFAASTGGANEIHEIRNLRVETSGDTGFSDPIVPEPSTIAISCLAFGMLALQHFRKNSAV